MKITSALAALSLVALSLAAHAEDAAPAAGADYVMLKVNGDDVKKSEIDEAWKTIFQGHDVPPFETFDPKVKDKFLREVASEHVLYAEAKKQNLENAPEVEESLKKLRRQLAIQQLLKNKTKDEVTDANLKAAYDAHVKAAMADAKDNVELKARHIVLKTKEEADSVEKKLKNGGDFAALAKEKSLDKNTSDVGGEIGWFSPDKQLPEVTAAALKLKKGETSAPVKTDFGWDVIQLEDRRKAAPPAFDEVKDALKQEVGNKAVGAYVNGLMADTKIDVVDAKGHETPLPPVEKDAPGKDGAAE